MIEPLRITFGVSCPPELTFELWTAHTSTWWPATHTVSAQPDVQVIIEPGVGGRIYERTSHGEEHDWGHVTRWEPPNHIAYLWHLRQDRADATEVDITFAATEQDGRPYRSSTTAGNGSALAARNAADKTNMAGPPCSRTSKPPPAGKIHEQHRDDELLRRNREPASRESNEPRSISAASSGCQCPCPGRTQKVYGARTYAAESLSGRETPPRYPRGRVVPATRRDEDELCGSRAEPPKFVVGWFVGSRRCVTVRVRLGGWRGTARRGRRPP